jgi:hypothetical protein
VTAAKAQGSMRGLRANLCLPRRKTKIKAQTAS